MIDVYCNPEDVELSVVAELAKQLSDDFDMIVVWEDRDGSLYFAQNSGCSCPSRFKGYVSVERLRCVGKTGFDAFKNQVDEWCDDYSDVSRRKKQEFVSSVRKKLFD